MRNIRSFINRHQVGSFFIVSLVDEYDEPIDGCIAHYNCRHGITRSLCYVRGNT
ncbi:MAG: hypothetical protein OEV79_00015 [candidate division WOR-3 bacterium]|nr:hypothetical protein [candidate division WOR-3 bacterium]